MSQESRQSATSQQGFGAKFKDSLWTLILAGLVAFGASWWNTQLSQSEQRFQINRQEERQKEGAQVDAEAALKIRQMEIRLAEQQIIVNNILEQLKDIKQEQQRSGRR